VEHLEDWERLAQPIVLAVWNVKLREGRWVLVHEAIADLDKILAGWRDNKTETTVHFPAENTVDETGLRNLGHRIGYRMYDIVAKG
jgi:hypothetical protein